MINFIEKHRYIALIFVLLIAIEIFYISSIQFASGGGESKINFALFYHAIVFFLFTFFLTALIKSTKKLKIKELLLIIGISLLYAASDEIHQLFVPGRVASIKDFLVDSFGIFLAILIYPNKRK